MLADAFSDVVGGLTEDTSFAEFANIPAYVNRAIVSYQSMLAEVRSVSEGIPLVIKRNKGGNRNVRMHAFGIFRMHSVSTLHYQQVPYIPNIGSSLPNSSMSARSNYFAIRYSSDLHYLGGYLQVALAITSDVLLYSDPDTSMAYQGETIARCDLYYDGEFIESYYNRNIGFEYTEVNTTSFSVNNFYLYVGSCMDVNIPVHIPVVECGKVSKVVINAEIINRGNTDNIYILDIMVTTEYITEDEYDESERFT